jgi:transcriptional regulator with XRE-family HTH domain
MAFSGEKLRQIRRQQGLSQRDMPVAHDTVSAIESGRRNPHPSTLRKLAEALGVEVRDFFEGVDAAPKATAPPSLAEWLEERCGHAYLTQSNGALEELFDTAHEAEVPQDAARLLFDRISQEYLAILKPGAISDAERLLLSPEVKRDAARKWSTAMIESGRILTADEEFQESVSHVQEVLAG